MRRLLEVGLLGFAVAVGGMVGGVAVVEAEEGAFQDVSVKQRIEPRYPGWAYKEGIGEGFARIAFYVDERGVASEFMAIEYSYEAFAEELIETARVWEFEPASVRGKPVRRVCHVYWEFLPDRAIETNALFDTSKRVDRKGAKAYRELQYKKGSELDRRIGMLSFPGLAIVRDEAKGRDEVESIRAKLSFYVDQRGNVALPQLLASDSPGLERQIEAAFKGAVFEIPLFEGEATIALLERSYDLPVLWLDEALPRQLD